MLFWGTYQRRQSRRYVGPRLLRALKVCTKNLNLTQYSTGNQYSLCSTGYMCAVREVPVRTCATAFWISRNLKSSALLLNTDCDPIAADFLQSWKQELTSFKALLLELLGQVLQSCSYLQQITAICVLKLTRILGGTFGSGEKGRIDHS